ncbi:MAG TPA: sulfolactaldehyde 3-reductase, partial [Sutterella sp.]|nr:sulfolactaldehyde 3-reductase [Sutterella sp.]
MSEVAFIGLGQMGLPMASNILKKGHRLTVYDINP